MDPIVRNDSLEHRLCLALGIPYVEHFLETISSTQFILWEEYFQKESFGFEMDNYRFGQMISAIYNVNRTSKSDKVFKPDDFFDFRKQTKIQDEDEMVEIAKNFASIFK